jgi:hypothetical protein
MQSSCSRRQILIVGLGSAIVASVGSRVVVSPALAQQKVSKQMVQYQDAPKAGHECSGCSNFLPPKSCRVVLGDVSPHGWCSVWTPK